MNKDVVIRMVAAFFFVALFWFFGFCLQGACQLLQALYIFWSHLSRNSTMDQLLICPALTGVLL